MSKTTVLIVEDDAGLREALVDTLLLADYQVVAADSAVTRNNTATIEDAAAYCL